MVKKEKGVSKIIQKNGIGSAKKKDQKMENVKKAVKAGLINTPEPVSAEFDELPLKNTGSKKLKADKKILEESKVESDEEVEIETESDEEKAQSESDEEEPQSQSDEEEAQNQSDEEAPDEMKTDREGKEELGEAVGYTILVLNLPPETKKEEIVKLFNSYGKVLSVIFSSPRGVTYNSLPGLRFKAFVVFDSVEAASKALEVNGSLVNDRKVVVSKCRRKHISNSTNTVFVRNIETNNVNKIRKFFTSCGSVKYVKFVKGAAFVCFNDPKSVESAFKLDGSMLDDKPIIVTKYDPQYKVIPTDKKALENLNPEELKEKVVELGKKYSKLMDKAQKIIKGRPYKSKFEQKKNKVKKGPKLVEKEK